MATRLLGGGGAGRDFGRELLVAIVDGRNPSFIGSFVMAFIT